MLNKMWYIGGVSFYLLIIAVSMVYMRSQYGPAVDKTPPKDERIKSSYVEVDLGELMGHRRFRHPLIHRHSHYTGKTPEIVFG